LTCYSIQESLEKKKVSEKKNEILEVFLKRPGEKQQIFFSVIFFKQLRPLIFHHFLLYVTKVLRLKFFFSH